MWGLFENITCCVGGAFLGPPGLGGESRGLSMPLESQSFLTGGGIGVATVAIDTSPILSQNIIENCYESNFFDLTNNS